MNQPHAGNPAETYEQYFVPAMFVPWANILLEHAALQPGERVLDVACGTGIVARRAASRVGETGQVAGLDMSPAMLAVAAAQAAASRTPIRWHEGNATALPWPEGSFDVVFCQHGLQFVPDRATAVREMYRVLAPGGRVLVMALQALALHPVFEVLVESVARHLALPVAAFMTPFALCDAEEFQGLFAEAGFAAVQVVPVSTVVRFPDPERFVPARGDQFVGGGAGFRAARSACASCSVGRRACGSQADHPEVYGGECRHVSDVRARGAWSEVTGADGGAATDRRGESSAGGPASKP